MALSKFRWVYTRDFPNSLDLLNECRKWKRQGYRVFVQGYSAMDCYEFTE